MGRVGCARDEMIEVLRKDGIDMTTSVLYPDLLIER